MIPRADGVHIRFRVTLLEQLGVEARKGCILSKEGIVNGLSCHEGDSALLKYFLEGPGVMVSVAVRNDDSRNQAGWDVVCQEDRRALGRRVNHVATLVEPEDVARGSSGGVKTVGAPENCDAKERGFENNSRFFTDFNSFWYFELS